MKKKCAICHQKEADNFFVNRWNFMMWVCDSCLQAELEEEKKED